MDKPQAAFKDKKFLETKEAIKAIKDNQALSQKDKNDFIKKKYKNILIMI